MSRSSRFLTAFATALVSAVLLTAAGSAQTNGTPERFTATAMNINNGRAGTIDITVNRWSTDKQRDQLMQVAAQKGPDKLLDALQQLPAVGHFGAPGNLSWDLHFARRMPLPEGGERIVLATDRRIGFWEATNQPRSVRLPVHRHRHPDEPRRRGRGQDVTRDQGDLRQEGEHDLPRKLRDLAGHVDPGPSREGHSLAALSRTTCFAGLSSRSAMNAA